MRAFQCIVSKAKNGVGVFFNAKREWRGES